MVELTERSPSLELRLGEYEDARICLVESSPESCPGLETHFRNAGFSGFSTFYTAHACQRAFEGGLVPDVVIISVNTLSMAGLSLLKYFRNSKDCQHLPILVIAKSSDAVIRREAIALGASSLISIPFDEVTLVWHVFNLIKAYRVTCELEEYKSRVSNELKIARRLQESLKPEETSLKACEKDTGLDISYASHSTSELSGDFWGVKELSDNKFTIFFADLVGHGISAAANTFRLHEILLNEELGDAGLVDFITRVNARFHSRTPTEVFSSLLVGSFDLIECKFTYVSAMATSPVLWRNGAKLPLMLYTSGVPLGVTTNPMYEAHSIPFMPGDMLFFYSDALIEAPSKKGGILGNLMPADIVTKAVLQTRRSVIGSIEEIFCEETNGPLQDDLTLLLIALKPKLEGEESLGSSDASVIVDSIDLCEPTDAGDADDK